jgi:hypothetical protein
MVASNQAKTARRRGVRSAPSGNRTRVGGLGSLDYSRIEDADQHRVVIVTPFVLESEYPGTTAVAVPSWWESSTTLRRRTECIVEGADQFHVETVDHGQRVTYAGSNPVVTAKAGVTRVGTHSKYGFGELRVLPIDAE